MLLNQFGEIADACWRKISAIRTNVRLDEYIVMPNHIHGILILKPSFVGATDPVAREGEERELLLATDPVAREGKGKNPSVATSRNIRDNGNPGFSDSSNFSLGFVGATDPVAREGEERELLLATDPVAYHEEKRELNRSIGSVAPTREEKERERATGSVAPTKNKRNDTEYQPNGPMPGSVGAIIGQYKSAVTKQINTSRNTPGKGVWQRDYFDHIGRDDRELYRIRQYIRNNPMQWECDEENTRRSSPRYVALPDPQRQL
ncbi:MAG: hypothetical protein JW768_08270 [Chitinispirillaceae bacterium]|nr:hypothetical protein [Chitinispirillaceae bacterium]